MENNLIEKLKECGFIAEYFETAKECREKIADLMPKGSVVGFGGSMTVEDMSLKPFLKERGFELLVPDETRTREELLPKEHFADFYILSANAATKNGELVNLDGTGNRIAASAFGPKNVVYIVGKNKIVDDLPAAIWRVKNVASPKNAKRLNKKTPCAVTGKCENCSSPERICRAWLITERALNKKNTFVFVVNEELGY